MPGGSRLLWILIGMALLVAMAWAADDSASSTGSAGGPPKAKVEAVEDTLHGHKIADPYRWLEDASSADSQAYVRDEMAYTRSLLDPLPGRDRIHDRLAQLLSIRR
jgi:prolyl oligopeptidase